MPSLPSWYQRLDSIIAALEQIQAPFLDRSAVEKLLDVKRRQAQAFLRGVDGFQIGRALLVERTSLLRHLHSIRDGEDWQRERRRRQRVGAAVDEALRWQKARQIKMPSGVRAYPGLPDGVTLYANEMRVQFTSYEELLRRFYSILQTIVSDEEGFRMTVEMGRNPFVGVTIKEEG